MNLRRATPADYLAITALDRVAWDTLEYPEKLADGEHTWRVWTEFALCWVAENEGEIIGVLLAFANLKSDVSDTMNRAQEREPLGESEANESKRNSGEAETYKPRDDIDLCLHKAFVAKEGRGKGVGSTLFDAFLYHCDEHRLSSFLTVAPFNEPAIALYEKMGFTKKEYVEGYYRPDEHRWVMEYLPRN